MAPDARASSAYRQTRRVAVTSKIVLRMALYSSTLRALSFVSTWRNLATPPRMGLCPPLSRPPIAAWNTTASVERCAISTCRRTALVRKPSASTITLSRKTCGMLPTWAWTPAGHTKTRSPPRDATATAALSPLPSESSLVTRLTRERCGRGSLIPLRRQRQSHPQVRRHWAHPASHSLPVRHVGTTPSCLRYDHRRLPPRREYGDRLLERRRTRCRTAYLRERDERRTPHRGQPPPRISQHRRPPWFFQRGRGQGHR
jgi:hypothetical protein